MAQDPCLGAHQAQVRCVSEYRPSEPVLAMYAGELEALFMADASLKCCAFAGALDETVLLAGGDGGHVHLLKLPHN